MYRYYPIVAGYLILPLLFVDLCLAESPPQVEIRNPEELDFLAKGMRANRDQIITLRGNLKSKCLINRGEDQFELNGDIHWISSEQRFKYESLFTQQHLNGQVSKKLIKQLNREIASANGVLLDFEPVHQRAWINTPESHFSADYKELMRRDPLYFGVAIYGAGLDNLMDGSAFVNNKYFLVPSSRQSAAKYEVHWNGKRDLGGRELHQVTVSINTYADDSVFNREIQFLVDPGFGFTVPRIISVSKSGEEGNVHVNVEVVIETKCENYDGVWIPVQTQYTKTSANSSESISISFSAANINEVVSQQDLEITLPKGTHVVDEISGITYKYNPLGVDSIVGGMREAVTKLENPNSIPALSGHHHLGETNSIETMDDVGSVLSDASMPYYTSLGAIALVISLSMLIYVIIVRHRKGSRIRRDRG